MSATTPRRTKWHPITPPRPPSPKIIHFPGSRRTRRRRKLSKHHNNDSLLQLVHQRYESRHKGKLENLFHVENNERPISSRRARVVEDANSSRIERNNKLEENMEEEIEDLGDELEELSKIKDYRVLRRSCIGLDKKVVLEKFGHVNRDINIPTSFDVDMLRKKMEEGILDASSASTSKRIDQLSATNYLSNTQLQMHMQQQEPMITTTAAMLQDNKCSGRCKAVVRRVVEQVRAETEQWSQMQEMLAQVRGEMEELQASRDFWENRAYNSDCEIQSLRHSVEEWKEKALRNENKANELQHELTVAKDEIQKAKSELVPLAKQIEKEKKLVLDFRSRKNRKTTVEEEEDQQRKEERTPKKELLPPLSLGKQLAKEKKMLLRRLKEHGRDFSEKGAKKKKDDEIEGEVMMTRSPLRDVHNNNNNLSPLTRQLSRSAFGFFRSPESLRIRESFMKVMNKH